MEGLIPLEEAQEQQMAAREAMEAAWTDFGEVADDDPSLRGMALHAEEATNTYRDMIIAAAKAEAVVEQTKIMLLSGECPTCHHNVMVEEVN